MYPHTTALARHLAKPIVAFDLEHTGGANATRSITDFGAVRITPDSDVQHYSSLVKPHACAVFNPHVSRLTGIYPSTVKNAPSWEQLLHEFVLPHEDALWVGFNSLSCDVPMLYRDSHRIGHALDLRDQLDLMRVGNLTGSLSKRVAAIRPDFDTSGAHRGLQDALMTLVLLEALLPQLTHEEVLLQRVHYTWREPSEAPNRAAPQTKPAPAGEQLDMELKQPRKAPAARRPKPVPAAQASSQSTRTSGKPQPVRPEPANPADIPRAEQQPVLLPPGQSRRGQPWDLDEINYVCSGFKAQRTIEHLAGDTERSRYAIACALHKAGLMSLEAREQYARR